MPYDRRVQSHRFQIPPELAGQRLDSALARLLPEHSRTRIKGWIEDGAVQVGRQRLQAPRSREAGSRVRVQTMPAEAARPEVCRRRLHCASVYEDRDVLVIDKPAGLVVHPGAGNPRHTLQNALLGLDPALAALPRAGLIHRLDKDTSGLLVVARTPEAQTSLSRQLVARTMAREYVAVCVGVMTGGGTIDEPIGRHRSDRLRMAVRDTGRPAVTHYRVLERFRAHTYFSVKLETGRTHQIRLHLSHLKYPIVGDPVYGGRFGAAARRDPSLSSIPCAASSARRCMPRPGVRSPAHGQAAELAKSGAAGLRAAARGPARGCADGRQRRCAGGCAQPVRAR